MKLSRCPVCHSQLHLENLVNDQAASELLGLLAPMGGRLARAVVAYVGLFRPQKSDLSFSRALKITHEALAINTNQDVLTVGLENTVMQIRSARVAGTATPLANHNYLKKVLSSVDDSVIGPAPSAAKSAAKPAVEVKSFSRPESLAETQAKFEARMAQFKTKNATGGANESE
ncbi:hypothetical protein [uncultured Shewanella sp.]|uniref:hypothetical protein n=1 Tax=uncultured Shewanella sp. TaxID=173975 RepID=UPI002613F1A3|nr:hypothetical protein [uncultured Shewanella sp.]